MVFILLVESFFQITKYYLSNIQVIPVFLHQHLLVGDTLRNFVYLNLPLPLRVEAEGALGPAFAWGIQQMGYPLYLLTILGIWKVLGAIALLIPKYPLLKEWAYAGIFFLLTGALFSHIASEHHWTEMVAAVVLLILTGLSWYFRPADRKL